MTGSDCSSGQCNSDCTCASAECASPDEMCAPGHPNCGECCYTGCTSLSCVFTPPGGCGGDGGGGTNPQACHLGSSENCDPVCTPCVGGQQTCDNGLCGQCWTIACCDPNAWGSWSTCSPTPGNGTQSRTNACGTVQTQDCCTNSAPSSFSLSSPTDNQILTSTTVSASWTSPNPSWGINCAGNDNKYTLYADLDSALANPATARCSNIGTNSCDFTLSSAGTYNWKVKASNGNVTPSYTSIQSFCVASEPDAPTLSIPSQDNILGNVEVKFEWVDIASWGEQCGLTTKNYKVYADTNADPTTEVCSTSSPTKTCTVTLLDQTTYNWKVVADNGSITNASTIRTFQIKQPKVCGSSPASTFYEDLNKNSCYDSPVEKPVAIDTIQISATPGGTCTTTDDTYCCTVPIDEPDTKVTLTATNFSPYTATGECSSCNSCVLNGCQPILNPGDDLCVNIPFYVNPWYQADGGSVYSNGDITSIIPANAEKYDNTVLNFDKYFVLNQAGTVLTNETLDFGLLGSASTPSRNWKDVGYSVNLSQFNYNFFQTRLGNRATLIEAGDISDSVVLENGILTSGVNTWPVADKSVFDIRGPVEVNDSNNLDGISAVIMSSGNITINNNFTPTSSFAFIAGGNIVVDDSVSEIHGLYFANGSFSDGITTDRGLKIKGGVTALTQINLQREWSSSYKPAEYFVADPALYVNLATTLGMPSYTWSEVAP